MSQSFKAGFVGLIGHPNAGKSTLMNALLGEKLAIVTKKPQTTRQKVCGIFSNEMGQAVFLDAPGVVNAQSGLNHFLQEEYKAVIQQSDLLLAVLNLDAATKEKLEEIIELVKESGKPWMAVLTKADVNKPQRVAMVRQLVEKDCLAVLEVSAKNRPQEAQETLVGKIIHHLPNSPAPLYDPESFTTHNMRELASEIVREKCFDFLHEEVPFGLAVQVLKYIEGDNLDKIHVAICIAKEAHKPMVIGKGGAKIKRIGQSARVDLEKILDKKVFLDVHVTVKENWMKNHKMLKEFGYVHSQR